MEPTNQNLNSNMGNIGTPEKKSHGALIGVIIILFLIIIGGLYFLGQRMSMGYSIPADTTSTTTDPVTDSMNTQSNSDDVSSIKADLNATNVDNVDQGATTVEATLK